MCLKMFLWKKKSWTISSSRSLGLVCTLCPSISFCLLELIPHSFWNLLQRCSSAGEFCRVWSSCGSCWYLSVSKVSSSSSKCPKQMQILKMVLLLLSQGCISVLFQKLLHRVFKKYFLSSASSSLCVARSGTWRFFFLWPFLFSSKSWYVSAQVCRIPSVIDLHLNRLEACDKKNSSSFYISDLRNPAGYTKSWGWGAALAVNCKCCIYSGRRNGSFELGFRFDFGEIAWNANELCRRTSAFVFLGSSSVWETAT